MRVLSKDGAAPLGAGVGAQKSASSSILPELGFLGLLGTFFSKGRKGVTLRPAPINEFFLGGVNGQRGDKTGVYPPYPPHPPTPFLGRRVLLKSEVCFVGFGLGAQNCSLRPDWAEVLPKRPPAPTPFFCRRTSLDPMSGFGCSGSGLKKGASQPIGPKSFPRGLLH